MVTWWSSFFFFRKPVSVVSSDNQTEADALGSLQSSLKDGPKSLGDLEHMMEKNIVSTNLSTYLSMNQSIIQSIIQSIYQSSYLSI